MTDATQSDFHEVSALAKVGAAIGSFFLSIAQSTARYQAVTELNALTDSQLDARGTTRLAEVERIFNLDGRY